MQIITPQESLAYFGLLDSTGNIERMQSIIDQVQTKLQAAYSGQLLSHLREDFFMVSSRVRPFDRNLLLLKLRLPFFTETDEFEIKRGPICSVNDFNPCFTCCTGITDGDGHFVDTDLGTVSVLCPCDEQMYRVRYRAGFEVVDDILQLPEAIKLELMPLIEIAWNALCADGDDDECNTCGTQVPAVMLKVQSNPMLFRFLPHAYAAVGSRPVRLEEDPDAVDVMADTDPDPDVAIAPGMEDQNATDPPPDEEFVAGA